VRRVVPLDQYLWGDRRDVLRGSLCRGEDHVALSKRERREGRDRKVLPRAVLTQVKEIAKDAGSRLVRERQHDGIALGAMTRVDELDEIFAPQGSMPGPCGSGRGSEIGMSRQRRLRARRELRPGHRVRQGPRRPVDEAECRDRFRLASRELERDARAPGMSNEHRPLETQRVDRVARVIDERRERIAGPDAVRRAMTALVERDEAPPLELRGDAHPEAGVRREAVKSEHPAAGVAGPFHVMQARAITLEPALARRQRSPSAARSFTSSPGSSAESESTPKCARRRITSRSSGSGMPYAWTRSPSACAAAQSSRETQYHRR